MVDIQSQRIDRFGEDGAAFGCPLCIVLCRLLDSCTYIRIWDLTNEKRE